MIKVKRMENNDLIDYEFSSYEEAFKSISLWKKEFLKDNYEDS